MQIGLHALFAFWFVRAIPKELPAARRSSFSFGFFIGSLLPDFDLYAEFVAYFFTSTANARQFHRTCTHSFIVAILICSLLLAYEKYGKWKHRKQGLIVYAAMSSVTDPLSDIQLAPLAVGLFSGLCLHNIFDLFLWFSKIDLAWPLGYFNWTKAVQLWTTEAQTSRYLRLALSSMEHLSCAFFFFLLRKAAMSGQFPAMYALKNNDTVSISISSNDNSDKQRLLPDSYSSSSSSSSSVVTPQRKLSSHQPTPRPNTPLPPKETIPSYFTDQSWTGVRMTVSLLNWTTWIEAFQGIGIAIAGPFLLDTELLYDACTFIPLLLFTFPLIVYFSWRLRTAIFVAPVEEFFQSASSPSATTYGGLPSSSGPVSVSGRPPLSSSASASLSSSHHNHHSHSVRSQSPIPGSYTPRSQALL